MAVDVERLRKECLYEASLPIESVAADLLRIEDVVAAWRATRKRFLVSGAIAIAAGLIALAFYWPAGLMLVASGVFLLVRAQHWPGAMVAHVGRCALMRSVAHMLAQDTEPGAAATVRLAFRPKRELLSEEPLPNRKNGKQRLYKESWFSVETCLCDGTTFTQTIDDLVRQRSFRNPRGKYKTKTRTLSLLGMRLAYPQKVYGDATPLRERMQKEIQVPAASSVRGVEVTGRIVKVKTLVTEFGDLAQSSSMVALGAYRMLNLSRELEARKRTQPQAGGAS